jgi:argininosuccinate lyase
MSDKAWDGRFTEKTDRLTEAFTASIGFDKRLFAHDIAGSIAHCRMLAQTGVISQQEAASLVQGLMRVRQDIERGRFTFDDALEDIHMHVEARLVQDLGSVAQKLHTARSRNDQIALDLRLYLRAESLGLIDMLIGLRQVLIDLARRHDDAILPGYTHLQRAQPVLLAHHLLAYVEMFTRDAQRLTDGLARINVMPLGAAALAGTTYPIDRACTAALLGFDAVAANSIDAVADRDFAIEFVAAAGIGMVHLSRLAEELVLWSSAEFGFIGLADAFATGSSIMPQKKNPDIPELVRGKAGRVFGDLMALLTLMKGLPLAYNRDMQEDKEPVFDAVDTYKASIAIFTRMLPTVTVHRDRMLAAASTGYLNATELADYLVGRGLPFRQAHAAAGKAVALAIAQAKELHELPLEDLKAVSALIEPDIFAILSPQQMIARRRSAGGTAPELVAAALDAARQRLIAEKRALDRLAQRLADAGPNR